MCGYALSLYLSHQIEPWFEGVLSWFPAGGADEAGVFFDELGGLDFAEKFFCTAADAVVVDFVGFQDAFGVDDEGSAKGETFVVDVGSHHVAEVAGRVCCHREANFLDRLGIVMPRFVCEYGIGANAYHFGIEFLEFWICIGHFFEFCRADERKVGRVEKENEPLSSVV